MFFNLEPAMFKSFDKQPETIGFIIEYLDPVSGFVCKDKQTDGRIKTVQGK